jgi:hypothetical protein
LVCNSHSTGLLQRRPVTARLQVYIGKESNNLEQRQAGLIHDIDETLATFNDARGEAWARLVLPVLRDFRAAQIAARAGLHRRTIERHVTGRSRPHPGTRLSSFHRSRTRTILLVRAETC